MARYKLTAAAVIDDIRYDIGSEIEYDGVPGPHMEPMDAPAKRAVAERDKEKPEETPPEQPPPEEPPEEEKPSPEPAVREEQRAGPGGHRRG